jgi:hypothetical protein
MTRSFATTTSRKSLADGQVLVTDDYDGLLDEGDRALRELRTERGLVHRLDEPRPQDAVNPLRSPLRR